MLHAARRFVPISQTPYILRDDLTQPRQVVMHMPIGVTREFLVLSVPEGGMEHNGRGPLLSAKEPDREICWRRCTQMMEICAQVCIVPVSGPWGA